MENEWNTDDVEDIINEFNHLINIFKTKYILDDESKELITQMETELQKDKINLGLILKNINILTKKIFE